MQAEPGIPIYDAHNHLQDSRLTPHLNEIIPGIEALPVRKLVVNGTREDDWDRVIALAAQYPWMIPSLGLHPWHVQEAKESWRDRLRHRVRTARCGVGEIGLDRWMRNPDLRAQEEAFVWQLNLAASLNRPVSIHCLQAWGRLLEILKGESRPECGFLIHSYGGPKEMIESFASLGGYFSLSGHFAHERKSRQREVFGKVPRERLLIETDAPDMLPPPALAPHRPGGLNDPRNIIEIYRFAAELLGMEWKELGAIVEANFRALFAPLVTG
jgi:TatD DNase family protein